MARVPGDVLPPAKHLSSQAPNLLCAMSRYLQLSSLRLHTANLAKLLMDHEPHLAATAK